MGERVDKKVFTSPTLTLEWHLLHSELSITPRREVTSRVLLKRSSTTPDVVPPWPESSSETLINTDSNPNTSLPPVMSSPLVRSLKVLPSAMLNKTPEIKVLLLELLEPTPSSLVTPKITTRLELDCHLVLERP